MNEAMLNNYNSNKMNENVIYKKQTNEIDNFANNLYDTKYCILYDQSINGISRISYKEIRAKITILR